MAIPADGKQLYTAITRHLGAVPPAFHKAMMVNFYEIAEKVGIDNLYPRILIVVDTNQVISYAIAKARAKSHPLDELLDDQYACLVSSIVLEQEFRRNVEKVGKKKKIDPSTLLEVWESRIVPRIDLRSRASKKAWSEAERIIGPIHRNDVPFMAVFLDIVGDVVLSWDHSFRTSMGDFAWRPGRARWAAVRVREGVIALYALTPIGTSAAKAIGILLWGIISALIEMARSAWRSLKETASDVAKEARTLPPLLRLGLAAVAIRSASRDDGIVRGWIEAAKARIHRWVSWAHAKLQGLIQWLRRWTSVLAELIRMLLEAVKSAAEELIHLRYGPKPRLEYGAPSTSWWLIAGS